MTPSLHDVVADPGDRALERLLVAHTEQLRAAIEAVGVEAAARATGVEPGTLEAVASGEAAVAGDLDLAAAAAVLALPDGAPAADELVSAGLDDLLFGMTTGVLDVDVVAAEVSLDLDPREVQGMLEGRHPLTLREYAALQRVIARRAK